MNIIVLAPSTDEYKLEEIIDVNFVNYMKSRDLNVHILETCNKTVMEWFRQILSMNHVFVFVDFYTLDDYVFVYSLLDNFGIRRSCNSNLSSLIFHNNKLAMRMYLENFFPDLNPDWWSTELPINDLKLIRKHISSSGSSGMIIIPNSRDYEQESGEFLFESFIESKEYGVVFLSGKFIGCYTIDIPNDEIFDENKKRNRTLYYKKYSMDVQVIDTLTRVIQKLNVPGLARFDIKFDGHKVTILELNSPATCDYGFLIDGGDSTVVYDEILRVLFCI